MKNKIIKKFIKKDSRKKFKKYIYKSKKEKYKNQNKE